jgi:hypothetical protein
MLLCCVAVIQTATMPSFFYVGDVEASRAEAVNWIKTGTLGISFEDRGELNFGDQTRGQYFFENDSKRKLFSKFGIGQTMAHLPPLWLEKLLVGDPPTIVHRSRSLLLILNLYHLFFALAAAVYLYLILSYYSKFESSKIILILAMLYTTYIWHYVRAPAHEVYHIPAFLAMCYHGLAVLRSRDADRMLMHVAAGATAAGILLLMKSIYVIFLGAFWFFVLIKLLRQRTDTDAPLIDRIKSQAPRVFPYLAIPSVIAIGTVLAGNHYRTGTMFNSGYGQWVDNLGLPAAHFSVAYVPSRVAAYLLKLGNMNLWIHFPICLLALPSLALFARKHRLEAAFLYSLFALLFATLCCFSSMGEWCHGPRYFVPVIVVLGIPLVLWLDRVHERPTGRNLVFALAGALMLIASMRLQINVNRLEYFADHHCHALFRPIGSAKIDAYFASPIHRGEIFGDLHAYALGRKEFYPVKAMDDYLLSSGKSQQLRDSMAGVIESRLRQLTKPNYFFMTNRATETEEVEGN